MTARERRQARAERQAAALLVVLAPIVACGVLAWLVILAAFLAPECVPDAPAGVCYWSEADALQVAGRARLVVARGRVRVAVGRTAVAASPPPRTVPSSPPAPQSSRTGPQPLGRGPVLTAHGKGTTVEDQPPRGGSLRARATS